MPKVNFNPQGTLIQDEALFVPPQSHITGTKFKLSHDVFSSVDFSITYNGEALVPQVDYVLTDVYERARQEMGLTVYQRVQFLPNAPLGSTSTVYVTYRAVGDFVDANEITNQTDNDGRYLKQIYNLSDIASPQSALKNLESAASETTDPEDFGYDDANEESFSDVMVQTNWGDGIPMKVPFKEFADETARAAIPNPLPVSKGGTNAQSIDGAISNILSGATSVDDDAVRDDGAVPFQCPSAYQHQNVGKITLLQIFNNWLKSKLQSWLGITVTESGGSITGRSFNGTSNKVANAITFSDDGAGAASGNTFNGSAARKLSYNSIGAAPIGFFMLTASDDYSATKTLTHISGVSKLNTGGMYLFYIPTTNKCNKGVNYAASFTYRGITYNVRLDPNRQPIADRYAAFACWGHGIYIAVINGTNIDLLKLSMGEKLVNFSLRSDNTSWGAFDDIVLEDGKEYIVYCDGFTFGSGEIYFSSINDGMGTSRIYLDNSLVTSGSTIPKGYYKCKNSSGPTYCQLYTLAV